MYYYASINNDGICQGVQTAPSLISAPNYIDITAEIDGGQSLEWFLFHKYEGGVWSEEDYKPESPPPAPSLADEIAAIKVQNAEILFALVSNDLL